MASWALSLIEDERFELVAELRELGKEHPHYNTKLAEVQIAERVERYLRGSMADRGWE